jgi:hypothetical protein
VRTELGLGAAGILRNRFWTASLLAGNVRSLSQTTIVQGPGSTYLWGIVNREEPMDDLDRYLANEYRDPVARREILASGVLPGRWSRLWGRLMALPSRGPLEDQTVTLGRGKLWSWKIGLPSPTMTCTAGRLWLTRRGDSRDVFLEPCESLTLTPGAWVVQALDPARFRIRTISVRQEVCQDETPLLPLFQRV